MAQSGAPTPNRMSRLTSKLSNRLVAARFVVTAYVGDACHGLRLARRRPYVPDRLIANYSDPDPTLLTPNFSTHKDATLIEGRNCARDGQHVDCFAHHNEALSTFFDAGDVLLPLFPSEPAAGFLLADLHPEITVIATAIV